MSDIDDEAAHRRLYASVIIQQLVDATSEPKTKLGKLHKRQALAWFTAEFGTTAQDFEEVCLAAEIPADRVRTFVQNYRGPPLTLHLLSRMRDAVLKGSLADEQEA